MSNFRKLRVWEKAYDLAVCTYQIATAMRRSLDLALRNQMVRAANSIPANIAEGRRQASEREFARFIGIAINSAFELEHHVTIAAAIGAISEADCTALINDTTEVRKMLYGLLRRIRERLEDEAKDDDNKTQPPIR